MAGEFNLLLQTNVGACVCIYNKLTYDINVTKCFNNQLHYCGLRSSV